MEKNLDSELPHAIFELRKAFTRAGIEYPELTKTMNQCLYSPRSTTASEQGSPIPEQLFSDLEEIRVEQTKLMRKTKKKLNAFRSANCLNIENRSRILAYENPHPKAPTDSKRARKNWDASERDLFEAEISTIRSSSNAKTWEALNKIKDEIEVIKDMICQNQELINKKQEFDYAHVLNVFDREEMNSSCSSCVLF